MKWDVSYQRATTGKLIFYSEDEEINPTRELLEADTSEDAIENIKKLIEELMLCNCLDVIKKDSKIEIFEPADKERIESYSDFSAVKMFSLLNECGEKYYSRTPGTFGGHSKLKIYGKLDCPSAVRHIQKGNYVAYRVFFASEEIAIKAGYRPCGVCMKKAYEQWKNKQ